MQHVNLPLILPTPILSGTLVSTREAQKRSGLMNITTVKHVIYGHWLGQLPAL